MRPLRDLPAAVSDLSGPRRGDGLATRTHLPDARGRRGPDRVDADLRASSRSLSRLSRLRDRVPVGGQVRLAPRGDADPAPPPRPAAPAPAPRGRDPLRVPRARAPGRRARGLQALPAERAPPPRARDARAPPVPPPRRARGAARRRAGGRVAAPADPGAGHGAGARRTPHGLRPAPSLSRGEPRHGEAPGARRLRGRRPARAGLLRRTRAARRTRGGVSLPRPGARRRVPGRPRLRRRQRRGLRVGDEGVWPLAPGDGRLRRARP